jgi:hypothetical protein
MQKYNEKIYIKIEKLLQNKFLSSITLQRTPELSFVSFVQILVNNIVGKRCCCAFFGS